jgi:uncharacterized RDD family membrane protein YckC
MLVCSKCLIPHHRECWDQNSGCTTYGCSDIKGIAQNNHITSSSRASTQFYEGALDIQLSEPIIIGSQNSGISQIAVNLNSYPKANSWRRLLSMLVDILNSVFIVWFFLFIVEWFTAGSDIYTAAFYIAIIWAFYYFMFRDSFGLAQSWGKRICNLIVINLEDGMPCNKSKSFQRNIVIVLFALAGYGTAIFIWEVAHINTMPFIIIAALLIEPFMCLLNKEGKRIGDLVAKTQIVEVRYYKEPFLQSNLIAESTVPLPAEKIHVSNVTVWVLAFAPLIGLFIEYAIAVSFSIDIGYLWFITLGLNIALTAKDSSDLKKDGYDPDKWGNIFIIPVYLFKRASYFKDNYAYAICWCVSFVVLFLIS